MSNSDFINSGDCLNCSRPLEVCPREAYHFALRTGFGAVHGIENGIERGDHHATQV
jgi:NAD-dependent dihydropyrimidine dehydrogenase PreA subunit